MLSFLQMIEQQMNFWDFLTVILNILILFSGWNNNNWFSVMLFIYPRVCLLETERARERKRAAKF